jgi:hypothetical protein
MLSGDDVQAGLSGSWRLMLGRTDGLNSLDLSADGFWNSFFAMIVAAPPLLLGWIAYANDLALSDAAVSRASMLPRLAMVDAAMWVVPIFLLALVVRPLRIADRFVAYVVASNWGTAVVTWLTVPLPVLRLFMPGATDAFLLVGLVMHIATLVLGWRLTNAAIGRGGAVATAVFVAMYAVSFGLLILLQALFAIPSLPAAS